MRNNRIFFEKTCNVVKYVLEFHSKLITTILFLSIARDDTV